MELLYRHVPKALMCKTYIHVSSSCNHASTGNIQKRDSNKTYQDTDWFLSLLEQTGCGVWTLENVPSVLKRYEGRYPSSRRIDIPTPAYSAYSTISREPGRRVLRSRWSVYKGRLPGPRYLGGGRAPRRPARPAAGETEGTFGTAASENCTGITLELRRFVFCFACGMRCWSVVRFKSIQHSNPGKWRLVSGLTARVGKKYIYITNM